MPLSPRVALGGGSPARAPFDSIMCGRHSVEELTLREPPEPLHEIRTKKGEQHVAAAEEHDPILRKIPNSGHRETAAGATAAPPNAAAI